MKSQSISAEKI